MAPMDPLDPGETWATQGNKAARAPKDLKVERDPKAILVSRGILDKQVMLVYQETRARLEVLAAGVVEVLLASRVRLAAKEHQVVREVRECQVAVVTMGSPGDREPLGMLDQMEDLVSQVPKEMTVLPELTATRVLLDQGDQTDPKEKWGLREPLDRTAVQESKADLESLVLMVNAERTGNLVPRESLAMMASLARTDNRAVMEGLDRLETSERQEIQVPLVVWVLQVRRVRQVLGESLVLMALTESQALRVKRVPLAMMDTREKTETKVIRVTPDQLETEGRLETLGLGVVQALLDLPA